MLKKISGAARPVCWRSRAPLAQTYPTKPVTMIIPFAAGGPTDVLGRVMAQRMSEILGQQVVVENVGGAGGMTGSKRVADAAPDGYTFVLGTVGTHAQSQTIYKKPLYNSATDFTPVALIAEVPIVLTTRKDLPVNDLQGIHRLRQGEPGKMQYGSAGAGSATHLGCVLLNYLIGSNITHVPYRGTGPAMQDLQGGRIDYLCEIITTAKPQIDGGTVKAIAIMTKERSPALPNLPTGLEQGTPNLEAYTWNAIFLPKGTPDDDRQEAQRRRRPGDEDAGVRESGSKGSAPVIVSDDRATPEYLGKFLKSEIEKWAAPIKASGASGAAPPPPRRDAPPTSGGGRRREEQNKKNETAPAPAATPPPGAQVKARGRGAGAARAAAGHSNPISPFPPGETPTRGGGTVAWAGNFSFPLSLPSARAWRTAFSISRWAVTPSVLRNLRMLVRLNTSSFI